MQKSGVQGKAPHTEDTQIARKTVSTALLFFVSAGADVIVGDVKVRPEVLNV